MRVATEVRVGVRERLGYDPRELGPVAERYARDLRVEVRQGVDAQRHEQYDRGEEEQSSFVCEGLLRQFDEPATARASPGTSERSVSLHPTYAPDLARKFPGVQYYKSGVVTEESSDGNRRPDCRRTEVSAATHSRDYRSPG